MMHHRTKKHHYYMRSLILLGFSLVLAHLLWTGYITFYLAPRLHNLCYVTFVILLLLTGSSFWQIPRQRIKAKKYAIVVGFSFCFLFLWDCLCLIKC
ncbi:hypothetical protein C4A75_00800 [Brevibacillus laterosporus]|nr:hypothetical protein C4A75_00800 [Brevibacillus laterosporus]